MDLIKKIQEIIAGLSVDNSFSGDWYQAITSAMGHWILGEIAVAFLVDVGIWSLFGISITFIPVITAALYYVLWEKLHQGSGGGGSLVDTLYWYCGGSALIARDTGDVWSFWTVVIVAAIGWFLIAWNRM